MQNFQVLIQKLLQIKQEIYLLNVFDAKLSSLNTKITLNKTGHLLIERELKKIKNIWFGLFHRKKSF